MSVGLAVAVVAYILFVPPTVTAIPSPGSISSDLSILTHNDLYGNTSFRHTFAAIVLDTPQTHAEAHIPSDALKSCAALGETLWNPEIRSQEDLHFLRSLDHGNSSAGVGRYWAGDIYQCQTVDTRGKLRREHCNSKYPVLCSQSAPLSSPASANTSSRWQTSVRSGNSTIVGYRDNLSFRFLGLKYGTVPGRFKYSRYNPPSSNTSALSYGPRCIQNGCTASTCSEDCLFLNIWTPYLPQGKAKPEKKKAVMLWIHGGGFTSGEGSDPTFDGGNLASRGNIVLVTLNYRLSTLGFLALASTTLKGNYGIADQVVALDWVRTHIEDFGGDKDRITVFGQSAGAASVRALLATPQARGKFSGAILQSNPAGLQYASTFSQYLTIDEATERTKAILEETGCKRNDTDSQLACLRAQDPIKLISGTSARYPVVDGTYLTSNALSLHKSAPHTNVALLAGVMRDDGSPFSKFSRSNASQALTEQGFNAAQILNSRAFPLPQSGNSTKDIFNLTSRVATDGMFRCLSQSTTAVGSKNGIFPVVYSYEFDRGYQISEWSPNPPACEAPLTNDRPFGDTRLPYFRCHSGELYYVFGTLIRQGRTPRDEDDIPFSQFIVDTWTAFAREGNPNPDPAFLAARGFTNSSRTVEKSGVWKPVDGLKRGSKALRILDVDVRDEGWREVEQCEVLGLPLDYYASLGHGNNTR